MRVADSVTTGHFRRNALILCQPEAQEFRGETNLAPQIYVTSRRLSGETVLIGHSLSPQMFPDVLRSENLELEITNCFSRLRYPSRTCGSICRSFLGEQRANLTLNAIQSYPMLFSQARPGICFRTNGPIGTLTENGDCVLPRSVDDAPSASMPGPAK